MGGEGEIFEIVPILGVTKWSASMGQNYGLYLSALCSRLFRIKFWSKYGGIHFKIFGYSPRNCSPNIHPFFQHFSTSI